MKSRVTCARSPRTSSSESWPRSANWRSLPELSIRLHPLRVRHAPVGPYCEDAASVGPRCRLRLATRTKGSKNVPCRICCYPNSSGTRPAGTRDVRNDEARPSDRPGGPTTELGPIDGKALHRRSDQRGLLLCDAAERTSERCICRVGPGHARGIRLGGEHVDPPGFVIAFETFQAGVRIRAPEIRADLCAFVLDGPVH